jgi:hypothetical protein
MTDTGSSFESLDVVLYLVGSASCVFCVCCAWFCDSSRLFALFWDSSLCDRFEYNRTRTLFTALYYLFGSASAELFRYFGVFAEPFLSVGLVNRVVFSRSLVAVNRVLRVLSVRQSRTVMYFL